MFHRALVKAVLVAVAIATLSGIVLQRPAHAATAPEQAFLDKINALRASQGVAPLQMNATVSSFAAGWTQHMVSTDTLAHNPDLASAPLAWTVVGENVGDGVSVDAVFNGFVNSPHHYANMVDPRFNIVGISVMTDSTGRIWTTHDFEQLPTSAPAPVAAPKPAPAPVKAAPAPAPRPAAPVVAAPAPAPAPVAAPAPAPAPVAAPVVAARTRRNRPPVRCGKRRRPAPLSPRSTIIKGRPGVRERILAPIRQDPTRKSWRRERVASPLPPPDPAGVLVTRLLAGLRSSV